MENDNKNKSQDNYSHKQATDSENHKTSLAGRIKSTVIAVAILVIVAAGAYFYVAFTTNGSSANSQVQAYSNHPIPVEVIKITNQTIPITQKFIGQTEASKTVQIRARVAGFLQSRNFTEGMQIKKGALLYRIDPSQYEADLNQAQATLEAGKAQLEYAKAQADRYKKLLEKKAVTTAEVQNWVSQANVARAQIAESKAKIEQAKLNLSYTYIKSPMDGMIGKSQKYEGAYLDAASNSLLTTVWKTNPIYVNMQINQDDLFRLRKLLKQGNSKASLNNLPVSLILSDGSTYPQKGHVDFVSITVDSSTSTATVRAVVPNRNYLLKPGQYIHVKLEGIKKHNAILVPQSVVMQNPSSTNVYVVDSQNTVRLRAIVPGKWYKSEWIIKSGLKQGDKVLANFLTKARPGMKVIPNIVTAQSVIKAEFDNKDNGKIGGNSTSTASKNVTHNNKGK